jgi:hypothetical protein
MANIKILSKNTLYKKEAEKKAESATTSVTFAPGPVCKSQ